MAQIFCSFSLEAYQQVLIKGTLLINSNLKQLKYPPHLFLQDMRHYCFKLKVALRGIHKALPRWRQNQNTAFLLQSKYSNLTLRTLRLHQKTWDYMFSEMTPGWWCQPDFCYGSDTAPIFGFSVSFSTMTLTDTANARDPYSIPHAISLENSNMIKYS